MVSDMARPSWLPISASWCSKSSGRRTLINWLAGFPLFRELAAKYLEGVEVMI